jgi:hypothetical protein
MSRRNLQWQMTRPDLTANTSLAVNSAGGPIGGPLGGATTSTTTSMEYHSGSFTERGGTSKRQREYPPSSRDRHERTFNPFQISGG